MDREAIGPYRIVRPLGKGGMGVVLEAERPDIDRRAAIKILHPELASNEEYAQRFLNEARAVNSIRHPGIVEIYDHGKLEDGTTYLIMEFIEGETLTRRLKNAGGVLPIEDASWICREVALAVAAAHKRGIIHRDLKPDNIMIAADAHSPRGERVKLLDFGIAKMRKGPGLAKAETAVGTVMGTLWYMSPEQLKNTADVDERADVYSLGALLFHLLTGQPPFRASTEAEQIALHLMQTPPPLRSLAPDVPEALGLLVDRMLLKDPQQRPSMLEVAAQLGGAASGAPLQPGLAPKESGQQAPISFRSDAGGAVSTGSGARRLGLPPSSSSTMSGAASEVDGLPLKQRQRRLLGVAAAALVPALGVLIWAATRPAQRAPAQPPALVTATPGPAEPAGPGQRPSEPLPTPPPVTPPPTSEAAPPATRKKPADPANKKVAAAPAHASQLLVSGCILDPKGAPLPAALKSAIVAAARSADLRLGSGQRVRMLREGSRVVFEPRGAVSEAKAQVFSGTLRGLLGSPQALPAEVSLKCGH